MIVRIFWAAGTAMLIIVKLSIIIIIIAFLNFYSSNLHDQPRQKIRHSPTDNKNSPEDQSQAEFS